MISDYIGLLVLELVERAMGKMSIFNLERLMTILKVNAVM